MNDPGLHLHLVSPPPFLLPAQNVSLPLGEIHPTGGCEQSSHQHGGLAPTGACLPTSTIPLPATVNVHVIWDGCCQGSMQETGAAWQYDQAVNLCLIANDLREEKMFPFPWVACNGPNGACHWNWQSNSKQLNWDPSGQEWRPKGQSLLSPLSQAGPPTGRPTLHPPSACSTLPLPYSTSHRSPTVPVPALQFYILLILAKSLTAITIL